jgi:hypothetical protein
VDSRNFVSKGKNTPFDGYQFKGKVMATVVDGKIVYIDELLKGQLDSFPCHSEEAERPKNLTQDKLCEGEKSHRG